MAHYIDKDALVAEIERRIQEIEVAEKSNSDVQSSLLFNAKILALHGILSFIDALPSKEEPKFKVGQTIRKEGCSGFIISKIENGWYYNPMGGYFPISAQDQWELVEEPVSIDFEQELYKAFGQVKDFTLGMRIAKRFYDMGKNSQEPVSEDFETTLAEEWKGYNERGAATVDALEDNTQELAFAKGFYRGWHYRKKEPVSEEEPTPKVLEDMFNAKSAAESLGISQEEHDKIVDECIYGKEPVSDELEEEIAMWMKEHFDRDMSRYSGCYLTNNSLLKYARHFANWQKERMLLNNDEYQTVPVATLDRLYASEKKLDQMMKDAIERTVKVDAGGYPYIDCDGIELYDYENDKPLAKKGQKAKVIIILED